MCIGKHLAAISFSFLIGSLLQAYDTPPGPARFASWPNSLACSSGRKFYELQKHPVYSDKVGILEISFPVSGYIYNLFGTIIPRKWWIFEPDTNLMQLDPVDALELAAQIPAPDIVAEALRIMPNTKAMEKQTANYGDVKIDAMHFIQLTCDTIEAKINRARLVKGLASTLGTAIALARYTKLPAYLAQFPLITDFVTIGEKMLPNEVVSNTKVAEKITWATLITLGVTGYMSHYLETLYIKGGIRCLELLVTSDQLFMSNKVEAKNLLTQLAEKINTFGFGDNYATQLNKLATLLY